LAGATWNDRLPSLVKARLVEALAGSGEFRAVSNGQDKINADVGLSSTLEAFQIDLLPQGRVARVAVLAKVVSESGGAVIASRQFQASEPVTGKDTAQHIAKLNAAFAKVTNELTAWLATAVDTRKTRRRATKSVVVGSNQRG
ncbi:MAG: ABC-type transport auxiliary lipoprotein family protein, partial [Hyphomicrobiaceae bacterium]